jgi:hypothetical protein
VIDRDGPEARIRKEDCRVVAVVFWLLREYQEKR